jgi:cadherin 20 type 2
VLCPCVYPDENEVPNRYLCRYSIDRGSDPGRFFYVDITTGALMTARPLDREEFSWHNITVLAMEMSK